MSQQTAQQATRIREEKSVATKIAKDSKKFFRDRENSVVTEKIMFNIVNRLKRKMFVATRKIMSRHTLEEEEHEKLVANRFGVTTQYIHVTTRTRLLHKYFVTTLSKSVAILSKSVATLSKSVITKSKK